MVIDKGAKGKENDVGMKNEKELVGPATESSIPSASNLKQKHLRRTRCIRTVTGARMLLPALLCSLNGLTTGTSTTSVDCGFSGGLSGLSRKRLLKQALE